jgi:hypothetical protein
MLIIIIANNNFKNKDDYMNIEIDNKNLNI